MLTPHLKAAPEASYDALRQFMDALVVRVETSEYIATDPVAFMHAYSEPDDMEIAGFFAASMAWGRRDIVMRKVEELLNRMGNRPAEFVRNYADNDVPRFDGFAHRTWNATDVDTICRLLQRVYQTHTSFGAFWGACYAEATQSGTNVMHRFHARFFGQIPELPTRTQKHIGNAAKGSSCKRLWLYLRWCLRKNSAVDLGIMNFMPVSELMIPLDVHVSRYARALGLLTRPSNDWKAVSELTENLRKLDPADPGKYDYALFGLGVYPDVRIPDHLHVNP